MTIGKRFGPLRTALRALGLSREAVDEILDWIADLLSGNEKNGAASQALEFPYHLRDDFLSPAELNFYSVLLNAIDGRAVVCTKVGLGDLFWVSPKDQSRYRTYTNKIDRKHVDFLLCEPATMRPLVGIELDDKSHTRDDRQERDKFVDGVFRAAGLPLLHIPARRAYNTAQVDTALAPYLAPNTNRRMATTLPDEESPAAVADEIPTCPQCGIPMVLRTAKNGKNAGNRFWGCSNYPKCRSIVAYGD